MPVLSGRGLSILSLCTHSRTLIYTAVRHKGKSRQRRDRTLHNRRFGHIDMPGHGADVDDISGILDPGQAAPGKVHHRFRAGWGGEAVTGLDALRASAAQ